MDVTLPCEGCGTPVPQTPRARRRKWCTDRCRKVKLYAGRCVDCGKPTNGYDGPGTAAERCHQCASAHHRPWPRERALAALTTFADELGRPPSVIEWRNAKRNGRDIPDAPSLQREFGSWSAFLAAAGMVPVSAGPLPGFKQLTLAQRRQVVERYAAGESSLDLAAAFGCSTTTIVKWARRAGVAVRPGRPRLERAA